MGADNVILLYEKVDVWAEIQKLTEGVDAVVVTVDVPEAQEDALKIVKPGGQSTTSPDCPLEFTESKSTPT